MGFVLVPIEQGRLWHELDVRVRVEAVRLPTAFFAVPETK